MHVKALKRNNPVLKRKNTRICRLNLKTLCRCSRSVGKGKETAWVISLSGVCCVSVKTSLPFNIVRGHPVRKKHPHPLKGRNPRALASLVNWKDFLSFLKQGMQLAAPSLPLLPFCVPWPSKPLASLSGLAYEPAGKVDVWGSTPVLAADVELSRWCFLCRNVSISSLTSILTKLLVLVASFVLSWCLFAFWMGLCVLQPVLEGLAMSGKQVRSFWENSNKKRQWVEAAIEDNRLEMTP